MMRGGDLWWEHGAGEIVAGGGLWWEVRERAVRAGCYKEILLIGG